MTSQAPAVSADQELRIGQDERVRYAALQDYLASAAEDDLAELVATDVSDAWGQTASSTRLWSNFSAG